MMSKVGKVSEGSDFLPLIRRMLSRAFYPRATTDPITLIQTHISYVLLTGEVVYKVQKPLRMDFLDFSILG